MLDTIDTVTSDIDNARAQIFGSDFQELTTKEAERKTMDPAVLQRLTDIENGSNPAAPNVSGGDPKETKGEIPEYLKEFEQALNQPLKPEEDKTDYTALFKQQTGEDATVNNRDEFEELVGKSLAKEEFFEENNLQNLQSVVDGGIEAGTVVQQVVKNNLIRSGLYTQGQYDRMVSEFFEEGELNEQGKAKYQEIVNMAKSEIKTLEAQAEKYANDKVEDDRRYRNILAQTAKTMKVAGVEMDEEMADHLVNHIRSGGLDSWFKSSTEEEFAQKQLMLALVSSPQAFARWVVKMDERTANHSVAKKVARLIS